MTDDQNFTNNGTHDDNAGQQQPQQPIQPVQPQQTPPPVQPIQPVQQTPPPVQPVPPAQPIQPQQPIQPAQPQAPINTGTPVPPPVQPVQPVQPIQQTPPPAQPVQPIQPIHPQQPIQPIQQTPPPAQNGGFPMPPAGQTGAPVPPPPPKTDEDTTPANFQLGQLIPATINISLPQNTLNFDQDQFLRLLAGSISLTKEEKLRIINSIPKLRQQQVDELIRIFEEEKRKFAALSKKHVPQLEKLAKKHAEDWKDIELEFKKESITEKENAEADEIRKKLGL